MSELEQLLKAYTLTNRQKRLLCSKRMQKPSSLYQKNKVQVLLAFWDKLIGVKQLTFHAKTLSKEEKGWNGKGQGKVIITKDGSNILIFSEKGTWRSTQGGEFNFSNTFRWNLDKNAGLISLEHLRRGPDHPVFLFHLSPSGKNSLTSVDSHVCKEDTYFGQIMFDNHSLRLNWRVIGPKKNEEIDYYYS
jgi:hypothetical protein